ncbi:MAG: anti-sigma factor family protein [Kiloniellales bacterium]
MTPADPPIGDDDLQAYVDDALPTVRRRVVAAYLEERPEVAARVQAYREQRDALAERCAAKLEQPIPPRLRLESVAAARRRRQLARLGRAAAAAVLLLAGGAIGWVSHQAWTTAGAGSERSLTAEAVASHRIYVVEVRHPVEVDASQEAHLVAWLSKRLGHAVRAPDLSGLGFRLMGGRLLPAATGPAAQFMFEDQAGRRLALYVRTDLETTETAFQYVEDQGVGAFYWIDRPLAYVLTGAIERGTLLDVAKAVYDQLD